MDSSFSICHACNKSMSDPRILPCAHSFCLQCLETSTISKESSKCPTCRMEFEMPQGGLKDLKKNEFISKLHEIQQGSSNEESCKVCNQNQAIRFCVDCSINLCASCLNCHKQFQGLKDHQLKAIKRKHEKKEGCDEHKQFEICNSCGKNQAAKFCIDCSYSFCLSCLDCHKNIPAARNYQITEIDAKPGKVEKNKSDYAVCGDHGETKNLFCFHCNNILCGLCLVLKHNGHKIIHISQYFDEMKKELDDNINAKELILQDIASNHEISENLKDENKRRLNELKKEIEKRGEEMKKNIDSVVEELKKNVDEKFIEYNIGADDVLLKLENLDKNINAHIETLKQQLNDLKDKMFIETSTLKEKFENIPKYEEYFNLTLSRDRIEDEIKSIFGKILDSSIEATYKFIVNVSSMTHTLYSPEFYVRQLPWCLAIYPYKITNDADSKKYLGIFLSCNKNSHFKGWSCNANYKFKLLANKPDSKLYATDYSKNFISKSNSWGRRKFIKMDELLDPNNGYVKDGNVTFEVYVKADEPKGV